MAPEGLRRLLMVIHNVPYQPTSFIGRSKELADLAELLTDPDCRLLTILAPGGMGKTRLALEVSTPQQANFADGIYFIALAPLTSIDHIVTAVGDGVGLQFYGNDTPNQQLVNYFDNKSVLLILDNFEHLLDGAGLVSDMLAAASGLKVLTTSREALKLKEEFLYPLRGMHFPPPSALAKSEEYSAIKLFVHHARRIRADFSLSEEREGVTRICVLVEGMPLAIELAAAWVRALSCAEIATEIEQSLDILATPLRNVADRHRSMRAVVEQSWKRLSEDEQAVFKKLSVFRGGFTRQAAQAVAGASLSTLAALVDKSLLGHNLGERYAIHELLRQYGEERLEADREDFVARYAHARYFADFLHQREILIRDMRRTADEIQAEYDNLLVSWYWLVDHQDFAALDRMMECLYRYGVGRVQSATQNFFGYALERLDPEPGEQPHPAWGRLVARSAAIYMEVSPFRDKFIPARLEQALAVTRQQGDLAELGFCLWARGISSYFHGNATEALAWLEECLNLYRQLEDGYCLAEAFFWRGHCRLILGRPEQALADYQQSYQLGRESGNKDAEAYGKGYWGYVTLVLGHAAEAERLLNEARPVFEAMDFTLGLILVENLLGLVALLKGDYLQARSRAETDLETVSIKSLRFFPPEETLGVLDCLEEAYTRGKQWCEKAVRLGLRDPWGLALACCGLREYPAAQQHVNELLQAGFRHREVLSLIQALPPQAMILAYHGDTEGAVELLALAFRHPDDLTAWMHDWPLLTRLHDQLLADLPPDVYAAAWQRGESSDLETVVAGLLQPFQALTNYPPTGTPAQSALDDPLTVRELEVLSLLVAGRSNREIAQSLVLALGTVKWYISEIYSKLDVSSRTQAIARAGELKLLS